MLCRKPTIVDGFHLSLEPKVAQNKSHSEVVGLPPGQLDYRRKRLQPVAWRDESRPINIITVHCFLGCCSGSHSSDTIKTPNRIEPSVNLPSEPPSLNEYRVSYVILAKSRS
uniref:Uncharacterized protein n=1 Tax=Agrobacterium tumefaciens TaxID=358 RepID=A0A3S5XA91_AGRTU|nr:hypothetical protein AgrTiEU6_201 [Agrobacterium tumefaciens]